MPKPEQITFEEATKKFKGKEGLVLLGCGGSLTEWVTGVSSVLFEEGVAKDKDPKTQWGGLYLLKTTGGRQDILMLFKKPNTLDLGKMAIWRLRFGDASWWSDYQVNYKSQHVGW